MKKLSYLLTIALVSSIALFSSCKDPVVKKPDGCGVCTTQECFELEKLTTTWTLEQATLESADITSTYAGMTLTFGSACESPVDYASTNGPTPFLATGTAVWGATQFLTIEGTQMTYDVNVDAGTLLVYYQTSDAVVKANNMQTMVLRFTTQ